MGIRSLVKGDVTACSSFSRYTASISLAGIMITSTSGRLPAASRITRCVTLLLPDRHDLTLMPYLASKGAMIKGKSWGRNAV